MQEKTQEKKKSTVVLSISQVFRNLSISFNLTVYSLYLIYLLFAIKNGVGVQIINIILAVMTGLFMIVYLALRMSDRRHAKKIKRIKRYYKNFKLFSKTVTSVTAVYSLLTAIKSVSPLAIIIAFLGALFFILRLLLEVAFFFVRLKMMKIKRSVTDKIKSFVPKKETEEQSFDIPEEENQEFDDFGEYDSSIYEKRINRSEKRIRREEDRRSRRSRGKQAKGEKEDIIIPLDQCVLSDLDEL